MYEVNGYLSMKGVVKSEVGGQVGGRCQVQYM